MGAVKYRVEVQDRGHWLKASTAQFETRAMAENWIRDYGQRGHRHDYRVVTA
jgi:hypothetical protein